MPNILVNRIEPVPLNSSFRKRVILRALLLTFNKVQEFSSCIVTTKRGKATAQHDSSLSPLRYYPTGPLVLRFHAVYLRSDDFRIFNSGERNSLHSPRFGHNFPTAVLTFIAIQLALWNHYRAHVACWKNNKKSLVN